MTTAHPSNIAKADAALSTVLNRRRQGFLDTRVVFSDVAAVLMAAGVLALVSGVWTIAVLVPNRLATVDAELKRFTAQSEERLRRLEANDQIQDDRILRLEGTR
jgi:hypothetical protein